MSDKTTILDKLKEYEKTGSYSAAIEDVYALIHQVADLEEEIDYLKEAADRRPVEGYGSDLPVGTVVLDVDKDAWQRTPSVRGGRRTPSSTPLRENREVR